MKENKNHTAVIGWIDNPYTTKFYQSVFTNEKKEALINRIKKRKYFFTHFDHQYIDNVIPLYSDFTYCILTKHQLDEVFAESYKDDVVECRKLPSDEPELVRCGDVLYEKQKFVPQD